MFDCSGTVLLGTEILFFLRFMTSIILLGADSESGVMEPSSEVVSFNSFKIS